MKIKNERRRDNILNAAANVFYINGYSATSVDQIIAQIGGSKRTIYNEFINKEGLFKALIEKQVKEFISTIKKKDFNKELIEENIYDFGVILMQNLMQIKAIGIFRIILTESNRFPELAKFFYENGPQEVSTTLKKMLENAKNEKKINNIDCEQSADNFVGMLKGNMHLKVLLGLREIPNDNEMKKYVKESVEIFLHGIKNKESIV